MFIYQPFRVYSQCADLTAETHFFAPDETFEANLEQLGWEQFFIKDFVKSNTADRGSIAHSPAEARQILEDIAQYRGQIEGGVAVRQVEAYRTHTEQRYFVVQGQPFSPEETIPALVHQVAERLQVPFYAVDIIETTDGQLRLVELGDGQVSDKKTWPLSKFVEVITSVCQAISPG